MKNKKVRILLSTYNGEKYLEELLSSLLKQTNVDVAISVRDDGSTDNTCQILSRWQGLNGLAWHRGENLGPAKSFMSLIDEVPLDSDFYAFCDQDDVWKPDKLSEASKVLSNIDNTKPALYFGAVINVDANLVPMADYNPYYTLNFGGALIVSNATGCTVVFNKCLLKKLKKYNPNYQIMHDAWAHKVCLALGGTTIFDENPHILYRHHDKNVIGKISTYKKNVCEKILGKIKMLYEKETYISLQAQEILDGYKDEMSLENIYLAECVANYRKNSINRLNLIINNKISTPYILRNLKFKFKVLMGRI
jgi:Glycosyltransferases involved in cell wall biogenesis